MTPRGNTLGKSERLSGKKSISTLLADGRWGGLGHFRYCWLAQPAADDFMPDQIGHLPSRILVSVPKRFFKRQAKPDETPHPRSLPPTKNRRSGRDVPVQFAGNRRLRNHLQGNRCHPETNHGCPAHGYWCRGRCRDCCRNCCRNCRRNCCRDCHRVCCRNRCRGRRRVYRRNKSGQ